MRGQGRVDRVNGVETGVEADRVVTVARQRADAVVVGGSHGFGDGMRQYRMGADLDEGGVIASGEDEGLFSPNRSCWSRMVVYVKYVRSD